MSKLRNEPMPQFEFGDLMQFLSRNGVTNQTARSVLGTAPNGRTRAEIADELRAWLKDRPKAQDS